VSGAPRATLSRGPERAVTMLVAAAIALGTAAAAACPFCGTVGRSLAERRDAAAVVAVGESAGPARDDGAGGRSQPFRIDQRLRGEAAAVVAGGHVLADVPGPIAGTAILFATPAADGAGGLVWSAVAADETLLGHVVAAPPVTQPDVDRLRWYAGRLEHPDAAIAADAFTEFGRAPFASVRAASDAIDPDRLAAWVDEPGIDARRRGLYGLLLGVVTAASRDPGRRAVFLAALHRAVDAPGADFRAGYDGILAGLLVAEAETGLDALRDRGLLRPDARPLDQRHLLAALRFAAESLPDRIPRSRIVAATTDLLASPAVAADATIDLARYEAWDAVDEVAGLWESRGADDPLIRRAVAGYLAACPLPAARQRLDALRGRQPDLVRQALEAATLPAPGPRDAE